VAAEKKIYFIIALLTFIAYIILAAQPIPKETILTSNWLRSLDSGINSGENGADAENAGDYLIPFSLGNRFGYAGSGGNLILNEEKKGIVSLSGDYWAEYESAPETVTIHHIRSGKETVLAPPWGYPLFIGGRIFIISKDQTTLGEIDGEGGSLWTYDFEAPLTCLDAGGGYTLTGTLDGMVDLLDSGGKPVFPSYAPGASRIPVILGCRISQDGEKLAIVSGVDKQRFLILEWYGEGDYRVTHHEFLQGEGFRREVKLAFIDNDSRVVFEQEAGLGVYDVKSRTTVTLPLPGKLEALDGNGEGGLFFFITSGADSAAGGKGQKRFVGLKLPGVKLIDIPFKSETSFLARQGRDIIVGGGMTLASFKLDKR
jgi:hypothetical protein